MSAILVLDMVIKKWIACKHLPEIMTSKFCVVLVAEAIEAVFPQLGSVFRRSPYVTLCRMLGITINADKKGPTKSLMDIHSVGAFYYSSRLTISFKSNTLRPYNNTTHCIHIIFTCIHTYLFYQNILTIEYGCLIKSCNLLGTKFTHRIPGFNYSLIKLLFQLRSGWEIKSPWYCGKSLLVQIMYLLIEKKPKVGNYLIYNIISNINFKSMYLYVLK